MRFLIVFAAALACASTAPSHLLPYAAYTAIPAIPFGAVRTVSSGDIQGAVIDAHVKAADFAQASVDKARLLSEQAVENLNTQVITTVDQGKEHLTDAFWATEDKKWQALDALKTAEAQIDGAIASKADILANSAVGAPYLAATASLAPIAPVVYSGYSSPALNSFSSQTIIHSHPEAAKAELESVKVDAHVKAADFAQATVDKARLLSEQAAENLNTQVITTVDQGKERLADAFWATEDKKWQALNALQTADAQIDGAIASKADILANSAVGAPYLAAASLAPIAPVVYSGYSSPALNSFSSQTIIQSNLEAAKAELESVKVEAAAKAAESAKEAESAKAKSAEAVSAAASAAAELKSEADKALAALTAPAFAPVAVAGAFPYTAGFGYSGVAISPDFGHAIALNNPGLKYFSTVQHVEPVATTFFKTKW